jgi:hypothetical protein
MPKWTMQQDTNTKMQASAQGAVPYSRGYAAQEPERQFSIVIGSCGRVEMKASSFDKENVLNFFLFLRMKSIID